MTTTTSAARLKAAISALLCVCGSATLARADEAAAIKPLPTTVLAAQTMKSVPETAPVYVRIFKEESELEVWRARADGRYVIIKTFPICRWSGALGPKEKQGDLMAPEGFYGVTRDGLKPDSKYHLALNVGYPNALDRSLGRTGNFIMVHGRCDSVGCFAMTDANIEEIYAFVRDAVETGTERVPVHIFPFRMTAPNMKRHTEHVARSTWKPLKEAYDDFARSQIPPKVGICGKRYVVNAVMPLNGAADDACPARIGKLIAPISPKLAKRLASAKQPLVAEGPKMRLAEDIAKWDSHRSGLGMTSVLGISFSFSSTSAAPASKPAADKDADLGSVKPMQ